jgi:hypothetical protein
MKENDFLSLSLSISLSLFHSLALSVKTTMAASNALHGLLDLITGVLSGDGCVEVRSNLRLRGFTIVLEDPNCLYFARYRFNKMCSLGLLI